jgi:DNA repair protein RadC
LHGSFLIRNLYIATDIRGFIIALLMTHYLIRDLNHDEKPREKMHKLGSSNLTDAELLAILLRSGGKGVSALELGSQLIKTFGGLRGLAGLGLNKLLEIKNIDLAKASAIKAAIEMGLRLDSEESNSPALIKKPEDIFRLVKKDLYKKAQEHLYVISLNARNKLVSRDLISIGTVNEAMISPREIFKCAFNNNATAIILVHNHPSGETSPSAEDISATQKIAAAGEELGIPLLDHLIVSDNKYSSLNALNLLKGGDKKCKRKAE